MHLQQGPGVTRLACSLEEGDTVIIPKKHNPQSLAECRNLSCTQFFSKTLKRIVFERLSKETKLSESQYGGQKGSGVEHMLVDCWTTILNDLEGGGRSSNLISLDFEKAFNRLDHGTCLNAMVKHGASQMCCNLVHSFLQGRTMTTKMGNCLSKPRHVSGGSPQGSI